MKITRKQLKVLIESYLLKENADTSDLSFGIIIVHKEEDVIDFENNEIEIEDIDVFKDFFSAELDSNYIKHEYIDVVSFEEGKQIVRERNSAEGVIENILKKHDVAVIAIPMEYLDEQNYQEFNVSLRFYFKHKDPNFQPDPKGNFKVKNLEEREKSYQDSILIDLNHFLETSLNNIKLKNGTKESQNRWKQIFEKLQSDYVCTAKGAVYDKNGIADYDIDADVIRVRNKSGKEIEFSASDLPVDFEEISIYEILPGDSTMSGLKAEYIDGSKPDFEIPMVY